MNKFQWINYSRISHIVPITGINKLCIGSGTQIYNPVHFYCDRTNVDPQILIPDLLSIPSAGPVLSWDEITQQKCAELAQILIQGQRCILSWSGGIDSTYIAASLIRFLDASLLDNITIGLSAASIWENPYFYRDHIRPRFRHIQDIEHTTIDSDMLMISGVLGDKIMCPELCLQWAFENPGAQDVYLCKDRLLDHLKRFNNNVQEIEILWDLVFQSAKRAGIEIVTACDFLAWLAFNFAFVGMYYSDLGLTWLQDQCDIEQKNFLWFCDARWQRWAMSRSGRWHTVDAKWHDSYKKEAKQTIFALDRNQHFLALKQKINSVTPLQLTWKNSRHSGPWILAVDAQGKKIYTTDANLKKDLLETAITA